MPFAITLKYTDQTTETIRFEQTVPNQIFSHQIPSGKQILLPTFNLQRWVLAIGQLQRGEVGIDDLNTAQGFTLFPNPTSNNVTIRNSNPIGETIVIRLLNAQGEQLEQLTTSSAEYLLNLSRYPAGIYFVDIQIQKNHSVKKVVKL
jgi:hypothetical protein